MKIVVLDGYTLNPGDLSWDPLRQLGDVTVHDRTPADLTVERAAEAEIVLTNKTVLAKTEITQLSHMRYIGVLATGYNVVDCVVARKQGIPVTNVPEYGTESVAQMVFAHLLNLTQHVAQHADGVRRGRWSESPDFCYWDSPIVELGGKTLGLIGLGRIGRATARLAAAFGMRVVAYDAATLAPPPPGVDMVDLDRLFRESDVVSLHCPLTPETDKLVNAERLAQMKPSAFLINTSRGPVVDEAALAAALGAGALAGAGLDVLSTEPARSDHPLLQAPNCSITPHIAWASHESRQRLMRTAVENVRAFLAGEPVNVVN